MAVYIDLAKSATKINCIFFDSTEYKLTQLKANKDRPFLRSKSQKLTPHSVPPRLQNWSPHQSGAWQQVEQAFPSTPSCWRSPGDSTGSSPAQRGGRPAPQLRLQQPGQHTTSRTVPSSSSGEPLVAGPCSG